MASNLSSSGMRQRRIRNLSRFFRWLSVLVGLLAVLMAYWSFRAPVVAIEPMYAFPGTHRTTELPVEAPTEPTVEPTVESGAETTAEPMMERTAESPVGPAVERHSSPRMYLVTSGNSPVFRYFTWDVQATGTGIREGREWMARCAAMLWHAYLLLGALLSYRLFRSYERGEIFAIAGVRWLKSVGLWMMGYWVVGMVFQISSLWWAVTMGLTFDLGVGLLPGLFVFLIGWILEEAQQIAEEQAFTV